MARHMRSPAAINGPAHAQYNIERSECRRMMEAGAGAESEDSASVNDSEHDLVQKAYI